MIGVACAPYMDFSHLAALRIFKTIGCSTLYRWAAGDGRRYSAMQEQLEQSGMVYEIKTDSWVWPKETPSQTV